MPQAKAGWLIKQGSFTFFCQLGENLRLEIPYNQSWGGSASYTLRARSPPQHLSIGKVPVGQHSANIQ